MGSPVSSVVANLFTEDFEERAMAEAGNLRPSSWDRYVDDVFSICKKDMCYERFLVPLLVKSSRQKGMQNTQH